MRLIYKCLACGKKWQEIRKKKDTICIACRSSVEGPDGPSVHIFKTGFYEHLAANPVHVTSKRQLKRECINRGLSSPYAWD